MSLLRPWLLLLLGLLSGSPAAWAQPSAGTAMPAPKAADTVGLAPARAAPVAKVPVAKVPATSAPAATKVAPGATVVATAPASSWPTIGGVLCGVAIGVLGAWLWARRGPGVSRPAQPRANAPSVPLVGGASGKPAQNVWKSPPSSSAASASALGPDSSAAEATPGAPATEQPGRNVAGQPRREASETTPKISGKPVGSGKKNKSNFNSCPSAADTPPGGGPAVPHRPATMNPDSPTPPPLATTHRLKPAKSSSGPHPPPRRPPCRQ